VTPEAFSLVSGGVTKEIRGKVRDAALGVSVLAEVGFGLVGADPTQNSGWSFYATSFEMSAADGEEYVGTLVAPLVKTTTIYSYAFRFSSDGGLTYTYCDGDGAGSELDAAFDPAALPNIVVNPK